MYRLLSFRDPQKGDRPGILVRDRVYDVGDEFESVLSILSAWSSAESRLIELAAEVGSNSKISGVPLDDLSLAPPIANPGALYCAGANYRDHVLEMTGKPPPPENTTPFFFLKSTRGTIIGPHDTIQLPSYSEKVDWEAEIGIIIGHETRNIAADDALDCVAGFTILNDLSARDLTKRHDVPFLFDWIGQKCFDTGCPMGPWITPISEIADPHDLSILLEVNGETKQNSSSSEMIFSCATQIAYLSKHITLYPGDVIATGTPAGCGMPKDTFLKAGDVVTVTIEKLGQLQNKVSR